MNTIKKSLVIAFMGASIAMSLAFINSPEEPSEVILIRGYIMVASGNANSIKIYRGSSPVEIIDLEKVKGKEAFDENISKVLETVNKYTAQGYEVISSTEFGGNAVVIFDFALAK